MALPAFIQAWKPQSVAAPARCWAGSAFYRPELDGLRFVCFLAVFLHHAFPVSPLRHPIVSTSVREFYCWLWSVAQAGSAGVDVFFTLSAYLITELLLREWERTGHLDVPAFYCRRALRIWPLYYTFLLLAWLVEPRVGLPGLSIGSVLAFAGFAGNWMMAWTGDIPRSAAQILWTVSIEEQFYLVWPLLLWIAGPKRIAHLAVGILVLASAARLMLVVEGGQATMLMFSTFTRMDGIACGALAAVALRRWPLQLAKPARYGLFIVGLIIPVATHRWLRLTPPFFGSELLAYPLTTVASVLLLLGSLRGAAETGGLLARRPIVYLGKISYGLYVWHLACILAVYKFGWARPGDWATFFFALPITIGISMASYQWMELPFLRVKKAFTRVVSRDDEPLALIEARS